VSRWRQNVFAVTAATFIGFTGFTLVMPFLPLYFRQLGVTDVGEIALWSGLSLGVTPAITAILAPLWGRLADRFGRKIMVERSLASFVVVMAFMAFVTQAWHVFALRAVQGLFAGYGALTLAMAADSAPKDRMPYAIGIVQTAQRLGPALGPVIGGAVAQFVGLRRAFLVTSAFYVVALVVVLVMYHEPRAPEAGAGNANGQVTFRNVLAFENFILLIVVIFALQFVDRSFGPVLPLFIAELGTPLERVPIVAGVLFSLAAGSAALGNTVCGWLMRRASARAVIAASSAAAAASALAYASATGTAALVAVTPIFGLASGAGMTAAYTAASRVIPAGARGSGFGVLSTGSLVGLALSPIVCGLLASTSIRAVFILDVVALLAVSAGVSRLMIPERLRATKAPAQEEL
jgi:DHA1 family multidrug resistance protein-like MFS transporter